jgi:transcriptional regulator with XRE-family HTH domain
VNSVQAAQWHFRPEPFGGESFSHFLGRYCAANYITPHTLAKHIEVGSVAIGRWRKLRYNPLPSKKHLQRLAEVTGVSPDRLLAMLPEEPMQIGTIRLCAACYGEMPYHRMRWQYKSTQFCDRHYLTLLARCPCCKAPFPIPAEWDAGICLRCGTAFRDMSTFQRPVAHQ